MPSSYQYIVNEQPIYTTLQNVSCSESTEYFNSICGMNAIIPSDDMYSKRNMEDSLPYLNIIEEPADTFRYRYKSEKGSHGGIKGESATRNKKSFPTVKMENCPSSWKKKVVIKVSLFTNEFEAKPHVYELTGKNCSDGKCETILDENFTAIFQSLAISTKKKEEVLEILKRRKLSEYDSYDEVSAEAEAVEEMKNINLDSAKLCFEAFFIDNKNTPLCEKVFSKPINNQKSAATGDLKIVRLSRCSGKCSGGEEVFLLCDKVKKEDIKVRFFEDHNGGWEEYGEFNPAEIHHQVAIVFKTPRYCQTDVNRKVYIELLRPSDGKCSEPRQFEYIPDNDYGFQHLSNKQRLDSRATNFVKNEFSEISRKRKRVNCVEDTGDSVTSLNSSILDSPQRTSEENMSLTNLGSWLLDDHMTFDLFPDITILPDISGDTKNASVEDQFLKFASFSEFNEIYPQSFVTADSVNQISFSMDSLSLTDHSCLQEIQRPKMKKSSKDFIDGMKTVLLNREDSTYLNYAPYLIPAKDENGNSMLHLAILEHSGNWNLIKGMLEMISEDVINSQNKFKETPLHLAIKGNHLQILLFLLAKDGDPNILERDGNNCLHLAAKYGHINCLKVLLLPSENRRTWKHKVTMDIDALNYDGLSALHIAIMRNFEDCMKFLLKCRANVNLSEKKCGRTALHLAVEQPFLLQTILKQPELDIFAKDFRGYTAVQLICVKIGKSFETISAQLKDDKDKIIKFLENFNQNDGTCDSRCSEVESDGESTCSSDFEDAVEDLSSITCKGVVSKIASTLDFKCLNEEKSSLMKTEEALYKYLDTNSNWKKIADLIGLDSERVAMFEKECSPGLTVIRKVKDLYHPCELQTVIEILKLAGLEEGICILQKRS